MKTTMEKKLYFKLSDGADIDGLILELSGAMEHIKLDSETILPEDIGEMEYTLTPIWMTDEEFKNLPEYQY